MTENRKRALRRPVQIALAAAAMMAVLCVTAAAANPEAVQRLWKSFTVSVLYQDEDTVVVQAELPEISVEREGDRVVLTIDGEKSDITEALERDSVYIQTFQNEAGTAELTVKADLSWDLSLPIKNGESVQYSSKDFSVTYSEDLGVQPVEGDTYVFTDDETMPNATYLPPEE